MLPVVVPVAAPLVGAAIRGIPRTATRLPTLAWTISVVSRVRRAVPAATTLLSGRLLCSTLAATVVDEWAVPVVLLAVLERILALPHAPAHHLCRTASLLLMPMHSGMCHVAVFIVLVKARECGSSECACMRANPPFYTGFLLIQETTRLLLRRPMRHRLCLRQLSTPLPLVMSKKSKEKARGGFHSGTMWSRLAFMNLILMHRLGGLFICIWGVGNSSSKLRFHDGWGFSLRLLCFLLFSVPPSRWSGIREKVGPSYSWYLAFIVSVMIDIFLLPYHTKDNAQRTWDGWLLLPLFRRLWSFGMMGYRCSNSIINQLLLGLLWLPRVITAWLALELHQKSGPSAAQVDSDLP